MASVDEPTEPKAAVCNVTEAKWLMLRQQLYMSFNLVLQMMIFHKM